jgi:hypothetical protein
MNRKYKKNLLLDLIEDEEEVINPVAIVPVRWGRVETYVFHDGDELYSVPISIDDEGWRLDCDDDLVECERVVPKEKVVVEYIPWTP